MVAQSSNDQLVLRRTYPASPEVVFQLWTTPESIKRWLKPTNDFTHTVVEVDLKVGGSYQIGFKSAEGKVDVVSGQFSVIQPPNKVVYTWTWDEPSEHAGVETQVTVEFLDKDGGTELVLTHEKFTIAGMKESHMGGWSGALDQLAEVIGQK